MKLIDGWEYEYGDNCVSQKNVYEYGGCFKVRARVISVLWTSIEYNIYWA
jgi:hypothetical protein